MAPIHVGCPIYDYQAIDVVGLTDLLNSSSKLVLQLIGEYGPVDNAALARAPEFVFHQIGAETRDPVTLLSSSLTLVPTTTVAECPALDILILGGPNPANFALDPQFAELVRRHVAAGKLLFTNCTGAAVAASTGVLDGRRATVNHVEYEYVAKRYPAVQWTRDVKWVVDGNVWTASGAVAGMDMVSHWLKENFGLDVLTYGAKGLDYEPRDVDGLLTVLPKRYDADGKQISTHVFSYHNGPA